MQNDRSKNPTSQEQLPPNGRPETFPAFLPQLFNHGVNRYHRLFDADVTGQESATRVNELSLGQANRKSQAVDAHLRIAYLLLQFRQFGGKDLQPLVRPRPWNMSCNGVILSDLPLLELVLIHLFFRPVLVPFQRVDLALAGGNIARQACEITCPCSGLFKHG